MGPVKTFLNLQMSILTSLPPSQESAPAPNNKWLLLTVLLVMMPENKQKSINNNLLRKNEPLNKTDTKLSCGKLHLRAWREREVAAVWAEERNRGMIDTKSDLGNENLAAWSFLCRGVMLFPDYGLLHTQKISHQTHSWVGLNNKVAPAQVVYPDTKAIPHIN